MSKKTYIQVAKELAQVSENQIMTKQQVIDLLARLFRDDNPRFDRNRFESACRAKD